MVDLMPQTEEEMEAIRNAVIQRGGLLVSLFDLLRRVPRRVLMLLKLNDLVRYCNFNHGFKFASVAYIPTGVWIGLCVQRILV